LQLSEWPQAGYAQGRCGKRPTGIHAPASITPPNHLSTDFQSFVSDYLVQGGGALAPIGRLAARRAVAAGLRDGNSDVEPVAVRMDLEREQRQSGKTFRQLWSELDRQYEERTADRVRAGQLGVRQGKFGSNDAAHPNAADAKALDALRSQIGDWDVEDRRGDELLIRAPQLSPLELELAIGLAAVHNDDRVDPRGAAVADIPAMISGGRFGMTTGPASRIVYQMMTSMQLKAIDSASEAVSRVLRRAAEVASTRDRNAPVEADSAYAFGHLLMGYLAARWPDIARGLAVDIYRHASANEIRHPSDPSVMLVVGGVQQPWAQERDINFAAVQQAFHERGMAFEQKAFLVDFSAFLRKLLHDSKQPGDIDRMLAQLCQAMFKVKSRTI
jgi:hypothetical protein